MPALDLFHNAVRNALLKDGWTITHDTLHIKWGKKDMYVDLGAKRILTAEREEEKIAVEVKSFISDSEMEDLKMLLDSLQLIALFSARLIQSISFISLSAILLMNPYLQNPLVN